MDLTFLFIFMSSNEGKKVINATAKHMRDFSLHSPLGNPIQVHDKKVSSSLFHLYLYTLDTFRLLGILNIYFRNEDVFSLNHFMINKQNTSEIDQAVKWSLVLSN